MIIVDQNLIRKILIEEYHYTKINADFFLKDFTQIHEELLPILEQFLKDRSVMSFDVFGTPLEDIVKSAHEKAALLVSLVRINTLYSQDLPLDKKQSAAKGLTMPRINYDANDMINNIKR